MVDSDEEPLVRSAVGRNVIPRLTQTVPSEFQCVRVVEASHPAPLDTQLDSTEWRVAPKRMDPQCLPVFPPTDEQVLLWWSHQIL